MKKFAVIGNPIKQSKSPIIHQDFAQQFAIELSYDRIEAPVDGFEQAVKLFFKSGGIGMNVTAPFKEHAFQLADQLTARASLAGAVNTLSYRDGIIYGDTTDGQGLVRDLMFHQIKLAEQKILLIGAGGAAKGCIQSLLEQKPAKLTVTNRTVEKAKDLVSKFNSNVVNASSFEQLINEYDVVINSTSCSLYNETPEIDVNLLSSAKVAYDMSYKSQTTSFNDWIATSTNAKTIDGLGMLVEQAAESFRIWHQELPNTERIRQTLRD